MQFKIVVDTPEDYKIWLKENQSKTIVSAVKADSQKAEGVEGEISTTDSTAVVAQVEVK